MFLIGRDVLLECSHCKRTMSAKELPMELAQKVRAGCFTKRNVLPMFTGLLLIAAVIGVSTVGVASEDRNTDS
ncbi:hypothetical protein [Aliagarivorans marinus]|uniref:hypothetical protein n=1 Tax=Aliagarivorans marinus TaxID=561965 RepID=UPI00040E9FED|nr:hypothetical protein [Aliagarivorans marinus]